MFQVTARIVGGASVPVSSEESYGEAVTAARDWAIDWCNLHGYPNADLALQGDNVIASTKIEYLIRGKKHYRANLLLVIRITETAEDGRDRGTGPFLPAAL